MKSKRGFTLIELLIVVAIIGILAAIAIPNFLEAQVRAKVSRCLGDIRTCVTGIELYRVDHNWSPLDSSTVNSGVIDYLKWIDEDGAVHGIGRLLTSPVAYLTSIPIDVFNTKMVKNLGPHNMSYNAREVSVFMRSSIPGVEDWGSGWCAFPKDEGDANLTYFGYMLSSCGPDLIPWPQNSGSNIYTALYYDPTNGTVSVGDICYFDTWGYRGGR